MGKTGIPTVLRVSTYQLPLGGHVKPPAGICLASQCRTTQATRVAEVAKTSSRAAITPRTARILANSATWHAKHVLVASCPMCIRDRRTPGKTQSVALFGTVRLSTPRSPGVSHIPAHRQRRVYSRSTRLACSCHELHVGDVAEFARIRTANVRSATDRPNSCEFGYHAR